MLKKFYKSGLVEVLINAKVNKKGKKQNRGKYFN